MRKLTKQYTDKSIQELTAEVQKMRTEIAKLLIEYKVKPQKDTNYIVKKKKELAVMLTLLQEKKDLELLTAQS